MKKFLILLLLLFTISSQSFAGSSFSSRSSYSSSRSSYNNPSRSSSFSSRSSYSGSSYRASSNNYNGRYTSGSSNNPTTASYHPTSGSPVVTRTTNVNNYGSNGTSYSGGPNALGTAAAVAGGVVAGNLISNSLSGHNHSAVVIQQPLQDNLQVQQDFNLIDQAQDRFPSSSGRVTINSQSDTSPLVIALGVIICIFVAALILVIFLR